MKKLILISFTLLLAFLIAKDTRLNQAYSNIKNNVSNVSNHYNEKYYEIEHAVNDFNQAKDEKVEQMNQTVDRINRIRAFLKEVDQRYFEYDYNTSLLEDIDCSEYLVKPDARCEALTEECGYYVDQNDNVIDLYDYCPKEYLEEAKDFFGLEYSE